MLFFLGGQSVSVVYYSFSRGKNIYNINSNVYQNILCFLYFHISLNLTFPSLMLNIGFVCLSEGCYD